MGWIDAGAVATKMMRLHEVGNRPHKHLLCVTASQDDVAARAAYAKATMARGINLRNPRPTFRCVTADHFVPEAVFVRTELSLIASANANNYLVEEHATVGPIGAIGYGKA